MSYIKLVITSQNPFFTDESPHFLPRPQARHDRWVPVIPYLNHWIFAYSSSDDRDAARAAAREVSARFAAHYRTRITDAAVEL